MKSLRIALVAAIVGAMAMASAAASATATFARDTGTTIREGAGAFAMGVFGALSIFALAIGEKADRVLARAALRTGVALGVVTQADTYTGKYPVLTQPPRSDILEVVIPFTMPAANVANGDVLALVKIPAGVKIVDWMIYTEDADTNGAPTIAYSLGTLNSASAPTALTTTYKAAITTLTNAGLQRCDTTTAQLESAANERPVGLLFTAAAATYAASKTGALVLKLSDA